MYSQNNLIYLAALIHKKRQSEGIGLRAAGEQCGISPSTLSRFERGLGAPDAEMMRKLSEWLNISVGKLLFEKGFEDPQELSTPEIIAMYLRSDKRLPKEAADTLAELVRLAYAQLASRDENS